MMDTPPYYLRTLYTVLFSVIMIIGGIGNVLVIVVIVKLKEMRNSTNILLANLAIADLLYLVIKGTQVLHDLYSELNIRQLNKGTCYAHTGVMPALAFVSVLTVIAVSFERYFAICQPLKAAYICTKSRAYKLCLLIWAFTVPFSSLRLLFVDYRPGKYINEKQFTPTCTDSDAFQRKAHLISIILVFCILPLMILIALYIKIAENLKRAAALSVNVAAMRHRRQVVRMVAAIVLSFSVCQMPRRTKILMTSMVGKREMTQWMGNERYENLSVICTLVLYLHAAVNPILYHVMSERFRAAFKCILCETVHGRQRSWGLRGSTSNNATSSSPANTTSNV